MATSPSELDAAHADTADRNPGDGVGVMESLSSSMSDVAERVGDLMSRGVDTLKEQYRVVSERGVEGVKDDVVDYTKREPFKALLLAGGIGALAVLILRRR
jgi:ElaB/YqjD/DUF883 family membrane-anchored ribosome-binding protein